MATEFDDSEHWGFFLTGQKLTSETGKYVRMSSLVLAALRAAGVFSTMEDGTTAPATDKLWLDKNTDPPTLKEWDATGASWVPMSYGRLFGQAAVGFLTVTGGTGNAVVISAPTGFQAERLYLVTPTATNTGAATIQVTGVGTYNVKYGDGSDLAAGEFTTGRQTALFFDGTKFVVILAVGASGVPDGSITTPKLANGVLSADATGRGKMADGFLSADTAGRAKMADGFVNTAKLASGALSADTSGRAKMSDGFLSADAPGRAKMADGFVTNAKLAAEVISAYPIPMVKSPPRLVWVDGTTVTVKAGKCRDELDAVNLVFPADINVVLAGAPTTAHRHVLVGYDGSGNPAAVFSTTDALPGGWQAYRRVGSIRTDGVGAIRQFNQYGDRFLYTSVITDILGSVAVNQLYDVQVPVGVPIDALVRALAFTNAAYMTVASPDESAPSNTSSGSLADLYTPSSVSAGRATIPTSTGQLRVLVNAATSWRVAVLGWIDRRGRDK